MPVCGHTLRCSAALVEATCYRSAVLNTPGLSCIVASPTPWRREETYMFSYFDDLECSACDATYAPTMLVNLCVCGAPLLARYRLDEAAAALDRDQLVGQTLWRYHAMLPVQSPAGVVSLGEGMTPLLRAERLGKRLGLNHLYIKDESLNPTGSFKARGLALAIARAAELGVTRVAIPSAGNAGGA